MTMRIYLAITFLFLSFSSFAQTIYVKSDATGIANGSDWGNAYVSILDAMENVNPGEDIWVAEGTYFLHQGGPTGDTSIWMKSDINVYGGFKGNELNLGDRNWENNTTVIDGREHATSNRRVSHVVIFSSITNSRLDGFTVQNGKTTGKTPALDEAACSTADAGLGGISQEVVLNCIGRSTGGGLLIHQSDPIIENCIITNNEAGKGGGAYIMVATSESDAAYPAPQFINCEISNNTATGRGGGVALDLHTDPIFTNCVFLNNICEDKGGAFYLDWACNPTLTNCLIAENHAIRGAGMGIDGTSLPTLTNCTVSNNTAQDIGAGLYTGSYKVSANTNPNEPNITNSIIWGNRNLWGGPADLAVWHTNHFYIENSIIGNGFNSSELTVLKNVNPMLVDTASGDYRLVLGSPAINNGTTSPNYSLAVPVKDLDGYNRDAIPDLGAFEYGSSLPVELLSFDAWLDSWKVQINWVTVTEINNDFFTVQHSIDGYSFFDLERVKGAGNTTIVKNYTTFHSEPRVGNNYYRLKQTDFDESFSYSDIKVVEILGGSFNIFPNPASQSITIVAEGLTPGLTDFEVVDVNGEILLHKTIDIKSDHYTTEWPEVETLSPGLYLLKIAQFGKPNLIKKFNKVRF